LNSNQRIVLVLVVVAVIGAGAVASLYVLSLGRSTSTDNGLPPGCTEPTGGFLIVASHLGYNESELHGAGITPGVTWPKMTVTQGQTVNITVCNTDVQAHSFEIEYYEQGQANTLVPQQVLHFSFVASRAGTFQVYCEIPCSIHIYMQSGQLVVTPA
jgi:plastocyanin